MQPTRSNRIEIMMYKVAKPQRGEKKGAEEYELARWSCDIDSVRGIRDYIEENPVDPVRCITPKQPSKRRPNRHKKKRKKNKKTNQFSVRWRSSIGSGSLSWNLLLAVFFTIQGQVNKLLTLHFSALPSTPAVRVIICWPGLCSPRRLSLQSKDLSYLRVLFWTTSGGGHLPVVMPFHDRQSET